ncbi:MAG: 3'(2'),5'-bisphosphate nucleotidase CysQ [Pontibacterium sp.]
MTQCPFQALVGIPLATLVDELNRISQAAGDAILNIYQHTDPGVEKKADNSPVTQADIAAHHIIEAGLTALTPTTPILSEEGHIEHQKRLNWPTLWCVDPLDGTKEFIAKTGEFTVNIALIHNNEPVLGIVYCPTLETFYWGYHLAPLSGAFKQQGQAGSHEIKARSLADAKPLVVTASRRNGQANQASARALLEEHFDQVDAIVSGSSLKMCLVAEGSADIYPRLHPTCEWDTAAADAILRAAGGSLIDAHTQQPLRYNKPDTLLNPWFFALADTEFPAHLLTQMSEFKKA